MVVEEVTLDAPGPNEVHVKWKASGVCHSDLSIWQGKLPIPPGSILGHEGAGVVVAAGANGAGLEAGDHVIGTFVPFCGECFYCNSGQSYVCEKSQEIGMGRMPFHRADGSVLFGGVGGLATFAEESVVHEGAVVKIPKDIAFEEACLIGCGVTTGIEPGQEQSGFLHLLRRSRVRGGGGTPRNKRHTRHPPSRGRQQGVWWSLSRLVLAWRDRLVQ